jgi:hypothetical protein
MDKRIRQAFVGLPDILNTGVGYYVALLQGVSLLLKTTPWRIFTCICALQMFIFAPVYSTEQDENCFKKDDAPPRVSREVRNTLNVTYTNRGSKEADKGRVNKEDQTPSSEFFL